MPPVLLIPKRLAELATLKVIRPFPTPAMPSWLLFILIAAVTAPALRIPVKALVPEDIEWLRIILPDMVSVETAAALLIAVKTPEPAWEQEIILLFVIDKTPVAFATVMPVKIEAPVPDTVQF